MTTKRRRRFTADFKKRVALEAMASYANVSIADFVRGAMVAAALSVQAQDRTARVAQISDALEELTRNASPAERARMVAASGVPEIKH